jgi:hypothetical protein
MALPSQLNHSDLCPLDAALISTLCEQKSSIEWRPRSNFHPGILFPTPFDVQKRIQQLRGYLDPNNSNYQPEQQHTNIKAAIRLYEDGEIDGVEQVFIKDGKPCP